MYLAHEKTVQVRSLLLLIAYNLAVHIHVPPHTTHTLRAGVMALEIWNLFAQAAMSEVRHSGSYGLWLRFGG